MDDRKIGEPEVRLGVQKGGQSAIKAEQDKIISLDYPLELDDKDDGKTLQQVQMEFIAQVVKDGRLVELLEMLESDPARLSDAMERATQMLESSSSVLAEVGVQSESVFKDSLHRQLDDFSKSKSGEQLQFSDGGKDEVPPDWFDELGQLLEADEENQSQIRYVSDAQKGAAMLVAVASVREMAAYSDDGAMHRREIEQADKMEKEAYNLLATVSLDEARSLVAVESERSGVPVGLDAENFGDASKRLGKEQAPEKSIKEWLAGSARMVGSPKNSQTATSLSGSDLKGDSKIPVPGDSAENFAGESEKQPGNKELAELIAASSSEANFLVIAGDDEFSFRRIDHAIDAAEKVGGQLMEFTDEGEFSYNKTNFEWVRSDGKTAFEILGQYEKDALERIVSRSESLQGNEPDDLIAGLGNLDGKDSLFVTTFDGLKSAKSLARASGEVYQKSFEKGAASEINSAEQEGARVEAAAAAKASINDAQKGAAMLAEAFGIRYNAAYADDASAARREIDYASAMEKDAYKLLAKVSITEAKDLLRVESAKSFDDPNFVPFNERMFGDADRSVGKGPETFKDSPTSLEPHFLEQANFEKVSDPGVYEQDFRSESNPSPTDGQKNSEQGKSTDSRKFVLPPELQDKYILTDRKLYERHGDGKPLAKFDPEKESIDVKTNDREKIQAIASTVAHNGWQSVTVSGSDDFKRAAWLELSARGVEVDGYKPNKHDQKELEKLVGLAKHEKEVVDSLANQIQKNSAPANAEEVMQAARVEIAALHVEVGRVLASEKGTTTIERRTGETVTLYGNGLEVAERGKDVVIRGDDLNNGRLHYSVTPQSVYSEKQLVTFEAQRDNNVWAENGVEILEADVEAEISQSLEDDHSFER